MFDNEVKHLYEELQRKLKTNAEISESGIKDELTDLREQKERAHV